MSGTEGVVEEKPHRVFVVIPVYQGELTLPRVVREISGLAAGAVTPLGHPFVVTEVLLVYDHGPDGSPRVLRELAAGYPFVRPIWLSPRRPRTGEPMAGVGGYCPPEVRNVRLVARSDNGNYIVHAYPGRQAIHEGGSDATVFVVRGQAAPVVRNECQTCRRRSAIQADSGKCGPWTPAGSRHDSEPDSRVAR